VTDRNEARARLEQTSAELAHAGRVSMLGQLSASIAHEVNQPLTAIINYGKSSKRFLARAEPDLASVDSCVDKMVSNATRAAYVVGRVRLLAKKASAAAEPIALAELFDDAMALIEREARANDVSVKRSGLQALPPVFADRVQVQQVLMNLLMNGIQAMRDVTGRARELCIHTDVTPDDMVSISVRDCGTGFPTANQDQIFEPFFTTKSDGMGMGLSICRSIVEVQGGRITAANNHDVGATVSFTLPTQIRSAQAVKHIS
jgi:C4-dicarboxylate-specific signal transduction histidine kinase